MSDELAEHAGFLPCIIVKCMGCLGSISIEPAHGDYVVERGRHPVLFENQSEALNRAEKLGFYVDSSRCYCADCRQAKGL